MKAVQEQSYKA